MFTYDFSIIIYNNNTDNLINCLKKIEEQIYELNKVEVIIETPKLDKEIKTQINKLKLNIIIREKQDFTIANCYSDGLKICKGEFINFSNSNIIFNNEETLLRIKNKSINHNFICCNIEYLDQDINTRERYVLSIKKNKNIKLEQTSGEINLNLESYFIHKDLLENIKFDKSFNEECKEKLILDLYQIKPTYYNINVTLISISPFEDNTSKCSIQYNPNWYIKSLDNWINYVKQFKVIPIYIEESIMYIIYAKYNCNFNDRNKKILSEEDYVKFKEKTKELLNYIDSKIILQHKKDGENKKIKHRFSINRSMELYFVKQKNNINSYVINNQIYQKEGFSRISILNLKKEKINVYAINYKNGKLIFDCTVGIKDYLEEDKIKLLVKYGEEIIEIKKTDIYNLQKLFGKTFNKKYTFQFEVNIKNNYNNLRVYLVYEDKEYALSFNFAKVQARLNKSKRAFWNYKDFTIENKRNKLIISKSNILKTFKLEILFILSKLKNEKDKKRVCKLAGLRILYYLTYPFLHNKHIWITFDKLFKSGDNGEYIYRYGINNNKNIYYIIRKDAPDYNRLKQENSSHILIYNSLKAKLYSLHAEVILDTHANAISYCGFEGLARDFVAGLFNAEIICIQHGLTMQDIAQFQNRLFDNIKLYCCASKYEIENLSKEIYGYTDEQLKLTGLARYDGLKSNDQKFILITPTWRRNVVNSSVAHIKKKHNSNFKNSDYFKIYNSLINNEKLIECAKKTGYKIIYLLHPAMSGQLEDFTKHEYVDIIPATSEINYEKILTEASLMVTDYSGVQYDFGYQRKSLIYYHPEILPPHYDVGMMDYEKIGFGPVCKTEEDIVKKLCENMENNCKIPKEYENRANEFYEFSDHNNCKRIIKEVEKYLNKLK